MRDRCLQLLHCNADCHRATHATGQLTTYALLDLNLCFYSSSFTIFCCNISCNALSRNVAGLSRAGCTLQASFIPRWSREPQLRFTAVYSRSDSQAMDTEPSTDVLQILAPLIEQYEFECLLSTKNAVQGRPASPVLRAKSVRDQREDSR